MVSGVCGDILAGIMARMNGLISTLARVSLATAALSFPLAGCDSGNADDEHGETGEPTADCANEARADDFAIGLSKSGTAATVTFMAADPAPPAIGDNTWTVAIADVGGQPLPDATITAVTPFMPDHGHGTAVEAFATPGDNAGEFILTPVNLHMAGLWEVTLDLDLGANATDQVVFSICVE
jgi:hypothetical protein